MPSKRIALLTAFTVITMLSTTLAVAPARAVSFVEPEVCQNSGCNAGGTSCYLAMGCKCFMVAGVCDGDEGCSET